MTPELDELERLALVPADRRVFEGFSGVYADCSIGRSILVGLFEVTRREWIETMDPQVVDQCRTYWHEYASLDLPATGMTRSEAHDFARRRGMRLLAAHEWIHVAVGRQTTYYPYGRVSQASWANTRELGLGRPALVGTFESGRSGSYGCYDLAGNVAEWVYGWVPSYSDFDVGSNVPWGTSTALGGSFRDLTRDLYGESRNANDTSPEFNGQTLDPRSRSSSIGLRYAVDAETYLLERGNLWGSGETARRRVRAVAAGWAEWVGRDAVLRLLEPLAEEPGVPLGVLWLLEGLR